MATYADDPRVITLRYPAVCRETGRKLRRGDTALWYPRSRAVYALETAAHRQYLADRHDMAMEDAMARACGL